MAYWMVRSQKISTQTAHLTQQVSPCTASSTVMAAGMVPDVEGAALPVGGAEDDDEDDVG